MFIGSYCYIWFSNAYFFIYPIEFFVFIDCLALDFYLRCEIANKLYYWPVVAGEFYFFIFEEVCFIKLFFLIEHRHESFVYTWTFVKKDPYILLWVPCMYKHWLHWEIQIWHFSAVGVKIITVTLYYSKYSILVNSIKMHTNTRIALIKLPSTDHNSNVVTNFWNACVNYNQAPMY